MPNGFGRPVSDECSCLSVSFLQLIISDGVQFSGRCIVLRGKAARPAALEAHELLTSDLGRARQCSHDACDWVYLDASPQHNR
ncbi:CGNR zinc finger domain-containing protein [Curtobacterium sp. 1310]|uniref:CGNR zinc finger domain-containing protein n=1 Tax=Curtobacterium sp. 1310 TaxID=2806570 RepID=UPI0035ABBA85